MKREYHDGYADGINDGRSSYQYYLISKLRDLEGELVDGPQAEGVRMAIDMVRRDRDGS